MDPADDSQAKTKFEETSNHPSSACSATTTLTALRNRHRRTFRTWSICSPDCRRHWMSLPMAKVSFSCATSRPGNWFSGASLLLGKRDIVAECAMVAWYDEG